MRKLLLTFLIAVASIVFGVCSPAHAFGYGFEGGCGGYNSVCVGGGLGLQTSVAAMWEFETTSWTDSSGNGNTLTASATPPTLVSSFNANVGQASSYVSGSSESLESTNTLGLAVGGGNFSIQVWVNQNGVPLGGGGILTKDDGFANREYWVRK